MSIMVTSQNTKLKIKINIGSDAQHDLFKPFN